MVLPSVSIFIELKLGFLYLHMNPCLSKFRMEISLQQLSLSIFSLVKYRFSNPVKCLPGTKQTTTPLESLVVPNVLLYNKKVCLSFHVLCFHRL
jgi:hypothetical protein